MATVATKDKYLHREEVAKIEVGHTNISPRAAWALIVLFLVSIAAVPAVQVVHDGLARDETCWGRFARDISGAGERLTDTRAAPWLVRRVFNANARLLRGINTFEDNLEDEALLGKLVHARTQALLTEWGGVGNEKAYLGSGQWVFFRPGIDYVTGRGFLEPASLAMRAAAGSEWQDAPQPDPRKAILEFKDQLASRGITLIVMPTPVKPTVQPEKLSARYADCKVPLQNPSFERFKRDLEARGVLVFDVAQALVDAKRSSGRDQYLAGDTHWRPEAMELAARRLKAFIEQHVALPAAPPRRYKTEAVGMENLGDVVVMLKLPAGQTIYRKQKVTVHQVLTDGGQLWRADKGADILLLGDSFTNVYSLEPMGWGSTAGLAERLSFSLQRGVDRISRNDNGAFATREMLSLALAKGRDRLAGKRVVVWQFAARELVIGDWKAVAMTLGVPVPGRFVVPAEGAEMIVTGIVEDVSAVPKPGSVPYKDHIVAVHLTDLATEAGPIAGGQAVVYMWSMRDNKWTTAARYRPGKRVKLRLKSWYDVSDGLDAIKRSELADDDLRLEDPCWGEEVGP